MLTNPSKRLSLTLLLLAMALLGRQNFGQKRDQKPAPQPQPSNSQLVPKAEKDDERRQRAQGIVDRLLADSKTIQNPIIRIKITMLVADAYWSLQPDKAREILSENFPKIRLIAAPQDEAEFGKTWSRTNEKKIEMYKGTAVEQIRSKLRREMLAIISSHDSKLARALIEAENKEKKDGPGEEHNEVLETAGELAQTDPDAAARIIKESLKNGSSDSVAFLLLRLRESSPNEASLIFNQMFANARARGELSELERLVPFILPTELDRLVGGKHYLTDPQRMRDAKSFIEYAAELLYRWIQTEVPSNTTLDAVKREYYLWRNLQGLFVDLKPDSVWLVNTRLRQLSAVLPQSTQRQTSGPWSDEKLKQLIAAADSASGDKRDQYLQEAAANAWRVGQGDLDQALALAEKIGNTELRDLVLTTIYFQAGLKYLRTEGPDYALNLATKINTPVARTKLYLAIIQALDSVKATERTNVLRDELLNWLRSRDKNYETAWALFDYLDSSANDNAERNFTALEIVVRVLNGPNPEPDVRLKNKVYWQPEFHDFRRSLMRLAEADFDRGLGIIQTLNNREVAMQVQAAFCSDYFRTRIRVTKASPVSKN